MDRILHGQPEAIARLNHKAPGEFERIVGKCLEKDPELRYQHASELCADLKRLKRDTESGKRPPNVPQMERHSLIWWGTLLVLAAMIAALGIQYFQHKDDRPETPLIPVPLTAARGVVTGSDLSPDGKQVAFAWYDEAHLAARGIPASHIYIKQIGSETPRQLTPDQHDDFSPAWSPDGLSVAFVRQWAPGNPAVMVIPANGGREHQVAELKRIAMASCHHLSWHPGGKWLAVAAADSPGEPTALHLLSPQTGEKRRLTPPGAGIGGDLQQVSGDTHPAFSPDGRRLAFSRYFAGDTVSEIFVVDLAAGLEIEGQPKQLTFGDRMTDCASWMPDGKHLVFTSGSKAHDCGLWTISVSGSDQPRPLPLLGTRAVHPSISFDNHRLICTVIF